MVEYGIEIGELLKNFVILKTRKYSMFSNTNAQLMSNFSTPLP